MDDLYDRQIRIWGALSQKLILHSNVLFLNCNVVTSEILKNLILSGLKNYTIVDSKAITEEDVLLYFFIDKDSLGQKLGSALINSFQNLNHEASGVFTDYDPHLIDGNMIDYSKYDLIVASNIHWSAYQTLYKVSNAFEIPLISISSFNQLTFMEIYFPMDFYYFNISDQYKYFDLKLLNTFPELQEYFNSFDLSLVSYENFSQIPFPVLLFKSLQIYKKMNIDEEEDFQINKAKLKDILHQDIFINRFGSREKPLNLIEAERNIHRTVNFNSLLIKNTFRSHEPQSRLKKSNPIILFMNCVKLFIDERSDTPMIANLPDMSCDSYNYLNIKNIYVNKFKEDYKRFIEIFHSTPENKYSWEELKECYPLINCIKRIKQAQTRLYNFIKKLFSSRKHLHWKFGILMSLRYFFSDTSLHQDDRQDHGFKKMKILEEFKSCNKNEEDFYSFKDYLSEIKFELEENIYTSSSLVAGIASQEIIKILTRHFKPLKNPLVFDCNFKGFQNISIIDYK